MKSAEIRQAFLDYFAEKNHQVIPSSSLVPGNDATLLFTNAGMVQFKDIFLGAEQRPHPRATTSQRCVRAGGKHNDLENVGYTARHHTFFEMLGNFSFGDYFKHDAIRFGWQFLTEVLGLPEEKLWVTVHVSDDEAAAIWLDELGVSAERFSRLDEDNFWQMGDTGPCGPCSEIFYDHGPEIWGGPPGSPEEDGDRYIEIWNLVFMQYQRQADGELVPLPNPSIDTGMGLERVAAVMQGVHNNYDIDLFVSLIKAASEATGEKDLENQSLRVIADHIRSSAFLISDGVLPSKEGRGYVLRRIIRRALRHGNKLGATDFFFHRLVSALAVEMGDAYPELRDKEQQISKVLLAEEEQFAKTLNHGLALLEEAIAVLNGKTLPGDLVFKLHDTYGFPTDLTNDIARERGLEIDIEGFEACMQVQRDQARSANKFDVSPIESFENQADTEFTGYTDLSTSAEVMAILVGGDSLEVLSEGSEATLLLNRTAFYAESGGQAGDKGFLLAEGARFDVSDCLKQGHFHLHKGALTSGELRVGDTVTSNVNSENRQATALNHSATHLLHAALRQVLGDHVNQQGSLVSSQRLRFDFSHFEAVTPDQLKEIEALVNQQIRLNTPVDVEVLPVAEAKAKGAMALFGEKYGDEVRVLSMGEGFSVELCGGTHVERTGDIGMLKIISESGIASGVRRVEAITGEAVEHHFHGTEQSLRELSHILKSERDPVAKARQLLAQNRQLEKQVSQLQVKLASGNTGDNGSTHKEVNGIKLLAKRIDDVDPKNLRTMLDQQKSKLESGVVLLGTVQGEKVALVCGVTKDLTDRVKAGELLSHIAQQVGGKGGGRADMAQGGGTQPQNLNAAIESAEPWLKNKLS